MNRAQEDAVGGTADPWARWLLQGRYGGDALQGNAVDAAVRKYADRVLDALPLTDGMTLADIGSGDGLIAFRAIERLGKGLRVVLADRSAALLERAQQIAAGRGVIGQCRFVQCDAEQLSPLPDGSVDALSTRAVLAYVPDKPKALREFHRVLKPGACFSLAEPIMQDDAFQVRALRLLLERTPPEQVQPLTRWLHRWKAAQFPDTEEGIKHCPLTNFGERDLIRMAQEVGFSALHLELHIDIVPPTAESWDAFVRSSPHPLAPSLQTILQERFTPVEREEFERTMRPLWHDQRAFGTTRIAYLSGRKPAG
ncbi:MAG TPA: methyltransferase domain-containing protein [Steroidobacteraceae bacterium]|nr:methyltransferase domain-containing protein [Steroidobacteraceae bacterium]